MTTSTLTVATVTYGDRGALVSRTVESALAVASTRVIVVCNGVSARSKAQLESVAARHDDRVQIVTFHTNRGSAPAFTEALTQAYRHNDPVLILDDDNPVSHEALDVLRTIDSSLTDSSRPLAYAMHRPVNNDQVAIVSGQPSSWVHRELTPGAFHGFDFAISIRRKFGRRETRPTSNLRRTWTVNDTEIVGMPIPVTMWGGLYLSRAAVALRLTPNPALVLYGDDNDFSRKFRESGGIIYLMPSLIIEDADAWRPKRTERGWKALFPSTFRTDPKSVWRLQYLFRNQAYLSTLQARGSRKALARLMMNATIRITGVLLLSVLAGRPTLGINLTRASLHGIRGKLGASYALPQ